MRREISATNGVRTTLVVNKLTGKRFPFLSDGFRVSLDNGASVLEPADFAVVSLKKSASRCEYELIDGKSNVSLKLIYDLAPDKFWSRKTIVIEPSDRLVNEIDVERFQLPASRVQRFDKPHVSTAPWDWPGGRPLFIDRQLFAGLEYPAGWNEDLNGWITLHHYPGRKGRIVSKTAVIGVAADLVNRRVEDAFAQYLDRNRIHMPRRFVLWNGYFHKFEEKGSMSANYPEATLKKKFVEGAKAFNDVGVQLDAVLIDGGWADPQSLMEEDHRAPGRIKLVRELAEQYIHAPIGVHVVTHGRRMSIDKQWLKQNFDMIDDIAYCFADPRAADLEIKNLLDDQKRHHLVAFKFDWGSFVCKRTDHRGHLPGERYAREAITDNQIRMLTALHNADPNVFLYNTGWYSPWWLLYYDAVFSGENDYNVGLTGPPSFSVNDLNETWRDSVIRRNIVEPGSQFPLSALMNHSPVSFKWNQETFRIDMGPLDTFANMILINYLRGNGLIEFYFNVYNLTPEERKIWGQITKWAKANDSILLANSKYIGGEPFKNGVYGYAHFTKTNNGIIGLRNPGMLAKDFSFRLDESIGFQKYTKKYSIRIAYPFEKTLGSKFAYGDTVSIEKLPRAGVVVLEVKPAAATTKQLSAPPRTLDLKNISREVRLVKTSGGVEGEYHFTTPANVRVRFVTLSQMNSFTLQNNITINARIDGNLATAKRFENCSNTLQKPAIWEPANGWVLNVIDLPIGESNLTYNLTAPDATSHAWLMTQSDADASLPVFSSGLPAAWKNEVKEELKLF